MSRPVAVALRYRRDVDPAPVVTATGKGELAERIAETARAHQVPIHEDPALAEALGALEIGTPIPVAVYAAVAEVIACLYRADRERALVGAGPGAIR